MSFTIPDGWTRLEGTTATHYFTTGDPEVCEGVVGSCDPSTYLMEPGTMDVSVEPFVDAELCIDELRPTWDGRTEDRPAPLREATYRLVWHVCDPDGLDGVRIAADIRAGDLAVRDGLLTDLRAFIQSFAFIFGDEGGIPPKG